MTTANAWLGYDGQTVNGEDLRRVVGALTGLRPGIFAPTDLAVTQQGTPAMAVDVAAGTVLIPGTSIAGNTIARWDATTALSIAASDPVNGRIDYIAAQAMSDGTDPELVVIAGTPSATPAAPTLPADHFILAEITVDAAVTSIVTAKITDHRRTTSSPDLTINQGQLATAQGGVIVCTSTTRPTVGLYAGVMAWETDTLRMIYYDGAAWQCVSQGPVDYSPTKTNFTVNDEYSYYERIGASGVHWHYAADIAAVTGNMDMTLPLSGKNNAAVSGVQQGEVWVLDITPRTNYDGWILFTATADPANIQFRATSSANTFTSTVPITWASGDLFGFDLFYETDAGV